MVIKRRKRKANFTRSVLVKITPEQFNNLHEITIILGIQENKTISVNKCIRDAITTYTQLKEREFLK